jgi:hypothetical protein
MRNGVILERGAKLSLTRSPTIHAAVAGESVITRGSVFDLRNPTGTATMFFAESITERRTFEAACVASRSVARRHVGCGVSRQVGRYIVADRPFSPESHAGIDRQVSPRMRTASTPKIGIREREIAAAIQVYLLTGTAR